MTAKDFERTYKALGLSQIEAAQMLGVDPRAVRYWSNGDQPVPEAVSKLLRLMLALKLSPSDVRGLLNE